MDLRFVPVSESEAETAALAQLLSGDEWPFHGTSRPSRETAEGWLAAGRFTGSGVRSGSVHDSFGYAILRQDWLSGGSTPAGL